MNDEMQRPDLVSPLDSSLQLALRGAVFPLSVQQLVWLARENEAPASVLTLLSALPGGVFASAGAVQCGVDALAAPAGPELPHVTPASR